MDSVLRAVVVYSVLFLLFRLAGKRTLAQITPFDMVLLLIVGEATSQGLIGDDFSITNAVVVVTTLLGMDVGISLIQRRFPVIGRYVEGLPVVIVEDGDPIEDRMRKARIDRWDILERARETQGLERMDQIKFAVLERSGSISIVPKAQARG